MTQHNPKTTVIRYCGCLKLTIVHKSNDTYDVHIADFATRTKFEPVRGFRLPPGAIAGDPTRANEAAARVALKYADFEDPRVSQGVATDHEGRPIFRRRRETHRR